MLSLPDEWKNKTNIEVKWFAKKGSRGMVTETTGKKLPRKIKVMLVNSLLQDLKMDIRIER
jgi:hypothetical protein